MKTLSYLPMLIALVAPLSTSANGGGNGVGNGGDPLRPLFARAQVLAAEKASRTLPCAFRPDVPVQVRDWIIANRDRFVADIASSAHTWVTDPQPTCAWTRDTAAAGITLSFEACRPLIRTEADAMRILFHESVHHFEITDEAFADAVAAAMDSATTVMNCPAEESDAFDPNACSGAPIDAKSFLSFFPPGGEEARPAAKPTPVLYRSRKCLGQTEDTCTEWKYFKSAVRDSHSYYGESAFSLTPVLTINQGMRVTLTGQEHFSLEVLGVGTERISADMNYPYFPWTGMFPASNADYDRAVFHGRGRMTRDCLVLQAKHDLENEAALLIRFGR